MIKYFSYIIIFAFSVFEARAVITDPVQITCTEVQDDGSVIIYWDNPNDLTDFKQFEVYQSNSSGTSGTLVGSSTNMNTTSFHHITNEANSYQLFYYVLILNQSDIPFASNVIGTIRLQLDNNQPDFNRADLFWTIPLPETSGDYNIYWDYNSLGWDLIGSSTGNFFHFDIDVCLDSINFKIEFENSNCSSISNVRGEWFKDTGYPEQTSFDSISINDNHHAVMGWQPSPSLDVAGYILYRYQNGTWNAFDTVVGINNTLFIDTLYDACIDNRAYAIASIDSCGNKSEGTFLQPERPITLHDIGYSVCAMADTLIWEQYIKLNTTIDNYHIWRSENGIDFSLVETISGQPASNPPPGVSAIQMWYIDESVDPGINYTFYVQAIFGDASSSSCKKTVTNYTYKVPLDIYFVNADVTPGNEINLALEVDTAVYSCLWEIHRINSLTNDVDNFKSLRRSEVNGPYIEFVDTDVDPQTTSYTYYAKVFDSCSILRLESNHLKTIFLEGSKPDEQTNHLSWNAFEGWETDVEKYYIYRSSRTASNFILIDSVDYQTFEYDDIISTEEANEGVFYYWVEAKQIVGIEYDYEAYSASNIVSLFFESSVYFPNAFRPDGITNEFKPIFNYFGGSDYVFQIYNRWGQLIFETSDPEEGWDGKTNGESTSSASFVYYLNYKNVHGLGIEKKGSVILLK